MSHEAVTLDAAGSPFRLHMENTYDAIRQALPPKRGKPGIHKSRDAMFRKMVGSEDAGPYMAIKTYIEIKANALLLTAETDLKKNCDGVFLKIMRDFDHICPVQEDEGLGTLERGKELLEHVKITKQKLEGHAKEALLDAKLKVT